jgi:hypothetical protein
MKEEEKAKLGAETLHSFAEQFGEPDEHVTILLEVLMEELWNASSLSLLSKSEEEGNQVSDNSPIQESSELPSVQPERDGTSQELGDKDTGII